MTDARLAILAFEGFEELDAIGPYEVFETAAEYGADWTVDLLATDRSDHVTAAHGLRVEPDGELTPETDLDYLVVPGGGWNDRATAGARTLATDDDLLGTLRSVHDGGTTVASVCTGGMVLAAAGLLDGRPAVTHHGAVEELRETGADVVEARVVDDGDLLTAGGITAGIDLALWLVEREWGHEVAYEVENVMEYERSTDVSRS
jgi:transcriptional regulator GlxA family with amidase domain